MIINKLCTECGNNYFDTCHLEQTAQCTNCNHSIAYVRRQPKGHYITSCATRFGDTYFLTSKGWLNMIGMDTKKTPITYARVTARIKHALENTPYGTEKVDTEFYPNEC